MVKGVNKKQRHAMAQERLRKWRWGLYSNVNRHNFLGSAPASRHRQSTGERTACVVLDEPLGALDLKLREQMQLELKSCNSLSVSLLSSLPTIRASVIDVRSGGGFQ